MIETTEKAIKHTYNIDTQSWSTSTIWIRLHSTPMAEGTNRLVYQMTDLSAPEGQQQCVAKAAKKPEKRNETMQDVVMQKKCELYAREYNNRNPPKKVAFIDACVIELIQRPVDQSGGHPLLIVEPFLKGSYKKHSNNFGYVDAGDRNTPQAFSHFTYAASKGALIIVDIQGVGDIYTDPQIHSNIPASAPPVWGQGDMGDVGIHKFFETHRCNALCEFFGLKGWLPGKNFDCGTKINTYSCLTEEPKIKEVVSYTSFNPLERERSNSCLLLQSGVNFGTNAPFTSLTPHITTTYSKFPEIRRTKSMCYPGTEGTRFVVIPPQLVY